MDQRPYLGTKRKHGDQGTIVISGKFMKPKQKCDTNCEALDQVMNLPDHQHHVNDPVGVVLAESSSIDKIPDSRHRHNGDYNVKMHVEVNMNGYGKDTRIAYGGKALFVNEENVDIAVHGMQTVNGNHDEDAKAGDEFCVSPTNNSGRQLSGHRRGKLVRPLKTRKVRQDQLTQFNDKERKQLQNRNFSAICDKFLSKDRNTLSNCNEYTKIKFLRFKEMIMQAAPSNFQNMDVEEFNMTFALLYDNMLKRVTLNEFDKLFKFASITKMLLIEALNDNTREFVYPCLLRTEKMVTQLCIIISTNLTNTYMGKCMYPSKCGEELVILR
jgi:hypothetical protein